jgi:hypothetical protein
MITAYHATRTRFREQGKEKRGTSSFRRRLGRFVKLCVFSVFELLLLSLLLPAVTIDVSVIIASEAAFGGYWSPLGVVGYEWRRKCSVLCVKYLWNCYRRLVSSNAESVYPFGMYAC